MKSIYLILFSFICVNNANSQIDGVYPYPENEGFWSFIHQVYAGGINEYEYTMMWAGDTIINGQEYLLLNPDQPNYSGGVRQDFDNEKLYYIDMNDEEHDISVNQHAEVGDTVVITPAMVQAYIGLVEIDSDLEQDSLIVNYSGLTNYAGYERKTYELTSNYNGSIYIYVSGVGFTSFMTLNVGRELQCFFDNGTIFYGDEVNPACSYSGIEDYTTTKLSLFPNPAKHEITIDIGQYQNQPISYNIVNSYGQLIEEGVLKQSQETIPTHKLQNGLYSINLMFSEEIHAKSFIISK